MPEKVAAQYSGKWVTNISAFIDNWRMKNKSDRYSEEEYAAFEKKSQASFEKGAEALLLRTQNRLVGDK